jgi:trehalose-6-phosphatase
VNAIIAEAEPGQPVTYLGDDLTDESAFRSVNAAEAPHLSVLMRREWRETAADVWLRPPEELREFLQRWVSAQRGKRSK